MSFQYDVEAIFHFVGNRKNNIYEGYRPAHMVEEAVPRRIQTSCSPPNKSGSYSTLTPKNKRYKIINLSK
jgi:hypothetical protein